MRLRYTTYYTILTLLLVALFVADVSVGSVFIPFSELFETPDGDLNSQVNHQILFNLRLPKALTAIIAGMGLSVTGMMMQTLFRNPLAGPYILGVSSGATLGVALVTMSATMLSVSVAGSWSVALAGIAGSTLVLMLVMLFSRHVRNNVSLLIVGMMIGSVVGAIVNVLQNFSNPDALKLFIVWTLGSLTSVTWSQMWLLLPLFALGMVLCLLLCKPLNGMLLGDNYAIGLGINMRRMRMSMVLVTGLLAGSITAFCGPIAFIGVAVPHLARGLMRTSEHHVVYWAAALLGANLLLVCDILSSLFSHPLPISTVSALFGAPIIIWIILRDKDKMI